MARAEAKRALASDPTNGAAYVLLMATFRSHYQWGETQWAVDRGLADNPGNGLLRSVSAILLALQGRTAEAIVEMRRAVDADPRSGWMHSLLGVFHSFAGEYDAAVGELERAWDLVPGAPSTRHWLTYAYHWSGRDEEALEAAVRELPPELAGLETAMREGFRETAFQGAVRASHEWRVASSGKPCTDQAVEGARALAIFGETEAMFECLGKAIDRKDLPYLEADPVYDPYRDDLRFAALLRRMNLVE